MTVVCRVQAGFLQDGQTLRGALPGALLRQRAGGSPGLSHPAQLHQASAPHTGRLAGLCSSGRSECVYRWIGWLGFALVAGQSVYTDGLVGWALV